MAVSLQNYAYLYSNPKGKPVFVPTEKTRRIALEIVSEVHDRFEFEPHYYHFTKGAHVAALHVHRTHTYFARLDLQNFFYSIGRNRVKADLKAIGVPSPERYARWSCVKNPYGQPSYALPYGFPQSPVLATLAMRRSALGAAIEALPDKIERSVYLDDIAISANDKSALTLAFDSLIEAAQSAGFTLNANKVAAPAEAIDLFNCDLAFGRTAVRAERVAAFYAKPASDESIAGFEGYRTCVEAGNR